jgi:hypothetical protein
MNYSDVGDTSDFRGVHLDVRSVPGVQLELVGAGKHMPIGDKQVGTKRPP